MEHKTVRGGDEYLPFARSQIRRLRATGQSYAAQKYLIGGVTVSMRIVGEDEFISIEGGTPEILSGVVKDGEIVNIPAAAGPPPVAAYDTLRAFKPTQNCWDTVLRKNPDKPVDSFNDEKKLAKAGTQYADLAASMYSGLMAKAVQVLMGMGKEVEYDYHAARCHGITTDNKGLLWLVEISATNGVIARRLPLTPLPNNDAETVDAVQACYAAFKGVPTGKSFPTGEALDVALTAGSVVQLCSVDDMSLYFSKLAFHADLGWSFSDTGDVAYNTCYEVNEDGSVVSYLFKITFTLTDEVKSAALTDEEHGELNTSFPYSSSIAFTFDGLYPVPARTLPAYTPDPTGSAPIFVCHIDGELDVVRCVTTATSSSTVFDPPYPEDPETGGGVEYYPPSYTWYYGVTGGKEVGGVHLQNQKHPNAYVVKGTLILFETEQVVFSPTQVYYSKAVFEEVRPETRYAGVLFWPRGCRDGYAKLSKDDGEIEHKSYRGVFSYRNVSDGVEYVGGYETNFIPETPIADYIPGYDGPPDGDGYDFIQYSYAGDTYPPLLFFKRTDLTIKSTFSTITRSSGLFADGDASDLGYYADAYGRLTYSTLGPEKHSAFTVPTYTYTPGASPTPVTAGGSRLVGPMLETESGSIDHTYNFIGYLK